MLLSFYFLGLIGSLAPVIDDAYGVHYTLNNFLESWRGKFKFKYNNTVANNTFPLVNEDSGKYWLMTGYLISFANVPFKFVLIGVAAFLMITAFAITTRFVRNDTGEYRLMSCFRCFNILVHIITFFEIVALIVFAIFIQFEYPNESEYFENIVLISRNIQMNMNAALQLANHQVNTISPYINEMENNWKLVNEKVDEYNFFGTPSIFINISEAIKKCKISNDELKLEVRDRNLSDLYYELIVPLHILLPEETIKLLGNYNRDDIIKNIVDIVQNSRGSDGKLYTNCNEILEDKTKHFYAYLQSIHNLLDEQILLINQWPTIIFPNLSHITNNVILNSVDSLNDGFIPYVDSFQDLISIFKIMLIVSIVLNVFFFIFIAIWTCTPCSCITICQILNAIVTIAVLFSGSILIGYVGFYEFAFRDYENSFKNGQNTLPSTVFFHNLLYCNGGTVSKSANFMDFSNGLEFDLLNTILKNNQLLTTQYRKEMNNLIEPLVCLSLTDKNAFYLNPSYSYLLDKNFINLDQTSRLREIYSTDPTILERNLIFLISESTGQNESSEIIFDYPECENWINDGWDKCKAWVRSQDNESIVEAFEAYNTSMFNEIRDFLSANFVNIGNFFGELIKTYPAEQSLLTNAKLLSGNFLINVSSGLLALVDNVLPSTSSNTFLYDSTWLSSIINTTCIDLNNNYITILKNVMNNDLQYPQLLFVFLFLHTILMVFLAFSNFIFKLVFGDRASTEELTLTSIDDQEEDAPSSSSSSSSSSKSSFSDIIPLPDSFSNASMGPLYGPISALSTDSLPKSEDIFPLTDSSSSTYEYTPTTFSVQ